MTISYFNYLWDIDGISAGSAIKAKEFVAATRRLGHEVFLEWRTPQPTSQHQANGHIRNGLKATLQKYLREPKRYFSNLPHLKQERQMLLRQNPDIFFPRLTYGNFSCLLLSKWLNLPTVVEADCPPTYEWEAFYAKDSLKAGNLSLKLETALLNHADAVITQSNQLSEYYIKQGVESDKIRMIPNAADIRKFQPREKDPELAAEFGLKDKVVLGWIGAGVAWTGIEVLTDVAVNLMDQNPNVRLLMLGSQKNMDFFKQKFHDAGYADRVLLPGFVPHEQIPRYLSCMDIVLAPYPKMDFFYASSMKLFEYMAAGKAVVATRVGQIAEVIDEGRNGFLFDPDNPAELADKIRALVDSKELREKIGTAARRDAENEWNWDRVAEKMVSVFEEVLQNRQGQTTQPQTY